MRIILPSLIALLLPPWASAQSGAPDDRGFDQASARAEQRLQASIDELDRLRDQIAADQIPLSRELSALEAELLQATAEYQRTVRLLDKRTLDLTTLQGRIKERQETAEYLTNLFIDYLRDFETSLHIAELQRYRDPLQAAKLAPENSNLSREQVFQEQASALTLSLDRIEEALGGTRFAGTAVDGKSRFVVPGTFVVLGPAALFLAEDGSAVGTAEERLGSLEPTSVAFSELEDANVAARVAEHGSGFFPLDPTLGNAHKIAATKETLWEHVQKGGPVMIPIFTLAAAALLVALFKWASLARLPKPRRSAIQALFKAVERHDEEEARRRARAIKGPVGRMLESGIEHIREPRDLIEEVMYENVLASKLKLQSLLPFIAICAASAPLLGLLGTVTGIIDTFKLITIFGSGDVKTLSGGISEALITTKFGLIVAIPSLLLHALLSRKARGVIDQMEKAAVGLVNQISKAPYAETRPIEEHGVMTPAPKQAVAGAPEREPIEATVSRLEHYFKTSGREEIEAMIERLSSTAGQAGKSSTSGREPVGVGG